MKQCINIIFLITGSLIIACTTVERPIPKIHQALSTNNSAEVLRMADKKGQLEALNEYEETPLLYSVKNGHKQLALRLIGKGAEVNYQNPRSGETPLLAAVKRGDAELVKMLIEAGARTDLADNENQTPLFWACRKGQLEVVETIADILGQQTIIAEKEALLSACGYGQAGVAEYLLLIGSNIESRTVREETPLILASRFGHLDIVRLLLVRGANVNAMDASGADALNWAARAGKELIVSALVDARAPVDRANTIGYTPLAHAVRLGHLKVTSFLLERGADLRVDLSTGEHMMYWAAFQDNMAELLNNGGATIERVKDDTDEPLALGSRYLWLARFYENHAFSTQDGTSRAQTQAKKCYGWAAEFFEMTAHDYDKAVKDLKTWEWIIKLRNITLNMMPATNAQMQAGFQARQMAELSALAHPGQVGVGYGFGMSPVVPLSLGSYKKLIIRYRSEAKKCRQTVAACQKSVRCFDMANYSATDALSCLKSAKKDFKHLK